MANPLSRRTLLGSATALAAGAVVAGSPGVASATAAKAGRRTEAGTQAVRAAAFLNSLGVCAHVGQGVDDADRSAAAVSYAGFRNVRDSDNASAAYVDQLISIHQRSGAKFVLVRSGPDEPWIDAQLDASRGLANAGALLALEGPNEPNNWAVTFGGRRSVWDQDFTPVAQWQAEFYRRAKADPVLRRYPVFHSSEAGGSEPNNVGLQFLTIPAGAGTLMPDGTAYADYANVHNYICRKPSIIDNMAWTNASSDFVDWIDGIYQEYGVTWRAHFPGYTEAADRAALPKVTTENGWPTGDPAAGKVTEEQQGRLYLNMYLSQFARGFEHTFLYMLRDGGGGDAGFGFFDVNYKPKRSALYLHNLTTILADSGDRQPGQLAYSITNQPETVHDLLMQKANGRFYLAVWNERASGSDDVLVDLGATYRNVRVFDPTVGVSPTRTLRNASAVSLTLSDHPEVIEIF
jgi:hypothetical protein